MDFNGSYDIVVRTPMGSMEQRLVLETIDGVLSGKVIDNGEEIPFDSPNITGDNSFEANIELPSPLGKFKSVVKATVEGDTISGKLKTPFGLAKYTGQKVK